MIMIMPYIESWQKKFDAAEELTPRYAQSSLTDHQIEVVVQPYEKFKDERDLARAATLEEIRAKEGNLSIPLYVVPSNYSANTSEGQSGQPDLPKCRNAWLESAQNVRGSLWKIFKPS